MGAGGALHARGGAACGPRRSRSCTPSSRRGGRGGPAGPHLLREPRQARDRGPRGQARGHEPRRPCAWRARWRATTAWSPATSASPGCTSRAAPRRATWCAQTFDEQLAVQVEEGVDFVIGETFSWLGEALLAVECGRRRRACPPWSRSASRTRSVTQRRQDRGRVREGPGGRGRRHRGHQLPAQPGAHPAAHGADAQGGERAPGLPARRLPHPQGQARLHQPARSSPSTSTRCSSAARRWPTTRAGPGTSASTTSAPAAARWRPTCGRWRVRSASVRRETRPWRVDYSKPMSAYEYYKHESSSDHS